MTKTTNVLITLFLIVSSSILNAQVSTTSELYKNLKKNDSLLFNVGFNTCNLSYWNTLLGEDLEFYHDKGGITKTKKDFITQFENGICGSRDFKSRRELIPGSLKVFPLYDNGQLYGAIQLGEHRFFESIKGAPEKEGSTAQFNHLWIKVNGTWKLKRALSYNHQINTSASQSKDINVSHRILQSYAGTYQAPQTGTVEIVAKENTLELKADGMQAIIYALSETEFAHKQAPLVFKFVKDAKGKVTKFIVIENGEPVEEAIKK